MQNPLIRADDERALLGSLLVNPRLYEQVAAVLRPEHFAIAHHQAIYQAIEAQSAGGLPATVASLEFHFKDEWTKKAPGDEIALGRYVSELTVSARHGHLVPGLAQELKLLWGHRGMIGAVETALFSKDMTLKGALDAALAGVDDVRMAMLDADETILSLPEHVDATITRINAIRDGTYEFQSVSTGLTDLDRQLIGFGAGEVWTIGGRPSMGKTTLATALMLKAAKTGVGVGMFSMEMNEQQLFPRLLSDLAYPYTQIPYTEIIRAKDLTEPHMRTIGRAQEELRKLPIDIDFASPLSVMQIAARVRFMRKKFEARGLRLGVVFIDFLKYIGDSGKYRGNRVQEIDEVMGGLRHIARDNNLCVVLLCQLNRQVESRDEKRPTTADLRDSGAIEQDSDIVLLLYREEHYLSKDPKVTVDADAATMAKLAKVKNKLEIGIGKSRSGETSTVHVFCSVPFSVVQDASRLHGSYGV